MALTIYTMAQNGRLEGAGPYDQERIAELPEGKPFLARLTQPRSTRHNSKYWVLLQKVAEGTGNSANELHQVIKLKCGCTRIIEIEGVQYKFPDSTAFHKMDQKEFNDFYERALEFIALTFGVSEKELLDEKGNENECR